MKNILLPLAIVISLCVSSVSAQSLKAYQKAADKAFEQEDYYNAVSYYEKVLKSKKKDPAIRYRYAEALRLSFDYKGAEDNYKLLVNSDKKYLFPKIDFHYATVLKHNGKYREAKNVFDQYIHNSSKQDFWYKKAIQEYASCDSARFILKRGANSSIFERLSNQVNTPFSDFGAHTVGEELYYSSLRFDRKPTQEEKKRTKRKERAARLIARLLTVKGKRKALEVEGLNEDKSVHTANSTLSADGQQLYFCYCQGERSDSALCEIYVSSKDEQGKWSTSKALGPNINVKGYTATQPHIVQDSIKGIEYLYFVSNRPGGKGKMDIWRVERKVGEEAFGELMNLPETINTIDDEATPFYKSSTGELYFSSKWHGGLGGYDIFKVQQINDSTWSKAANIGLPYNSAANDFYFWLNQEETVGYLASNRTGSKAITGESCCNDIYKFEYPQKTETPKEEPPVVVTTENPPSTTPTPPLTTEPPVVVTTANPPSTTSLEEDSIYLNSLLPLSLYFHNDEPDSNTTRKQTKKTYLEAYSEYLALKAEYKEEYSIQFKVERRPYMQKQVDNFFELTVRGEYNRTGEFMDLLLKRLEQGKAYKLLIRGYTSPRADENYNISLAHRRVDCVRKFMLDYKQGVLKKYIDNGSLKIKEIAIGEAQCPAGISDDLKDPQNSIYSVDASRQRKAEISFIMEQ